MKRSKILIPTLSVLAVAPATACGPSKSAAEEIIDAIIAPTKLIQEVEVDDIIKSFTQLSDEDRQKEVIYDIFGMCNNGSDGTLFFDKPLTTMWSENTVSFKTNITKCSMSISTDNKITSSFLGYISFVFTQDTTVTLFPSTKLTFKADDYVMYTYDFTNANISLDDKGALEYTSKIVGSAMGFAKVKYDDGQEEFMFNLIAPSTTNWKVKNSHNWVQKS